MEQAKTRKVHSPHRGWREGASFSLACYSLCGMFDVLTSTEPDVVDCQLCIKKIARDARKRRDRDMIKSSNSTKEVSHG